MHLGDLYQSDAHQQPGNRLLIAQYCHWIAIFSIETDQMHVLFHCRIYYSNAESLNGEHFTRKWKTVCGIEVTKNFLKPLRSWKKFIISIFSTLLPSARGHRVLHYFYGESYVQSIDVDQLMAAMSPGAII